MPVGEIERHPYLSMGQIAGSSKLILGSFPVYECTDEDNDYKRVNRLKEGTIRFFYGSNRNSLWSKYKSFIDDTINFPWNPDEIIDSLESRGISVSDLITSCERYVYKTNKKGERILFPCSSEDSALRNVKWNYEGIQELISYGVRKILCTSKGVLSNLEKQVIFKNGFGRADIELSKSFQQNFITEIGGEVKSITKPIAKTFLIKNHLVEAIALPSPGSPQRQIREFGFNGDNWRVYVEAYFEKAFRWLVL
jgi:hypothetical protein